MDPWMLRRTVQCAKCPWRKDVNPRDIPNGYSEAKHRALSKTIAEPGSLLSITNGSHVMACHEDHEAYCIGWLWNQIGIGNNIGMRVRMLTCENGNLLRVIGEQHKTFDDTLPDL